MQTPKSRTSSSGVAISLEVSDKDSPLAVSSEVSRKRSPRQLKTSPRYSEPTASSLNLATVPPKERSPSVRKSPRSTLSEEKRRSRVAGLECQLSQLENELKAVKDQLCSSETSKKQARKDAEESNQDQQSNDSAALDEIEQLKGRLEMVAESESAQTKHSESARIELKEELAEALSFVEDMKNQLSECKKSEAEAQGRVGETLMQLETAKKMVEALRLDGCKATEARDAVKSELEQSRARVYFLEELVSKLNGEIWCKEPRNKDEHVEIEVARSREETKNALDMVEQIKSASGRREAELEAELRKSSYEIEELKANLMDKETELQGICEENETLLTQLEKTVPIKREYELKKEIKKMQTHLNDVLEENERLKLKINEMSKANKANQDILQGAEREAATKVSCMREEMDERNRKVARVTEQLEAAQAANAEMEAELRRQKVQSDQWRKAAEVAATMLSVGSNGQFVDRTSSMDHSYGDEFDDDIKRKNVNMLRRFGVLWRKPLK